MAEIKAVLTPYVTTSLSFMSMISFDFMSMLQSGFIASSFVGTYLLLVLVFMVGFVISALLRSWQSPSFRRRIGHFSGTLGYPPSL
jgi:predicted RND superfamily exporter protein